MSVTRQQFQAVAANLAQEVFADFFIDRVFTIAGGTNPITGAPISGTTFTVPMVRDDYNAAEFQSQPIEVGDFKLLGEVAAFGNNNPKANGLQVNVDGVQCRVINARKDPADAVWELQVRKL
jgi:hypothetical protein